MMAMSLLMTTARSVTAFVAPSTCRSGAIHCRRRVASVHVSSFATAPQSIDTVDANDNDDNAKTSAQDAQPPKQNSKKKKGGNKLRGKEKRRQFIGMAKAVDRGQWANVYKPGGDDGMSFTAESGLPDRTRPFTVLGIESSCDDTGAAVVRSDGTILGESLASQNEIHEEWGGIVPGLAKNAHGKRLMK